MRTLHLLITLLAIAPLQPAAALEERTTLGQGEPLLSDSATPLAGNAAGWQPITLPD